MSHWVPDRKLSSNEKLSILKYWDGYFSRSPFRRKLGVIIDSLDEKGALVHLDIQPEFHWQTANIVHGGVIASIIDCAIATAARWYLEKGQRTVTTDLNIHYLRSAETGRLFANAEIIHSGKTMMMGTCRVYTEEKQVSFGTASYRVLAIN